MNKETLEKKCSETEQRFNELQKQRLDIETELAKLQGEWRGYQTLLNELNDPATTIEAKPEKRKRG